MFVNWYSAGFTHGQSKLIHWNIHNPLRSGNYEELEEMKHKEKGKGKEKDKGGNKPLLSIFSHGVKATIWLNKSKDTGKKYFSIGIVATYKDANKDYQQSSNFFQSQLLNVAFVAQQAASYCLKNNSLIFEERKEEEEEEEQEEEDR